MYRWPKKSKPLLSVTFTPAHHEHGTRLNCVDSRTVSIHAAISSVNRAAGARTTVS